ncbi:hypothetical protein ACMA5I_09685 [Paracoccaceae bacterium GXU_MW_L88]
MGFSFTNPFSGLLSFAGHVVENVATGLANGISTAVSVVDEGLSHVGNVIADSTAHIPVINGVTAGLATIVDDATDAVEIVAHHAMMMVAEAGQAVETVASTVGDSLDAVASGDLDCVAYILKDGLGEILVANQQYTAAHIAHDVELVMIPIGMVSEAGSEILEGILGDNFISDAPLILDDVQHLAIDAGLYDSLLVPAMEAYADANSAIFGDDYEVLTHADMGMGYLWDHPMNAEMDMFALA